MPKAKASGPKRRADGGGARAEVLKRQKTRADVRAETPPDQAGAKTGEEILIAELAKLDLLQYAMRKKKTAKDLGITVDELNKIVSKARTRKPGQHDPAHWQVEPWPEPVATGDLLHELIAVYTRYVILPEHAAITMALWDLHAWSIETAYCSPFLMFTSPEMRCGKSTALSLLHWTGPRTILASNISPAALFRYIEAARPTLLIDEGETFLKENEEARGILNSGHTRDTAIVIRLVGDNHDPQPFSTWGAKAIASIGKLAATLRDRAIVIPMIRKRRSDRVEKLRRKKDTETFTTLRQKARRWFKDNVATLEAADPVLPDALNDRAADNWEPLLAIADLAGGDWPIRARSAALKLSGEVEIDIQSIGAQLLAAIQTVLFEFNTDRIWSEKLAGVLGNDADSPWAAYGKSGKPITQRQIADLLRPYGIEPDSVRIGDRTKKGYYLTQFTSVFETYVAYPPSQSGTAEQPYEHGHILNFPSGTGVERVPDENSEKPNNDGLCSGVPDEKGGQADVDRSCRQCDGPLDGTEELHVIDGQEVWLHPECVKYFRQRATKKGGQ